MPRLVIVDCSPGFASGHDRIYIYGRSGGGLTVAPDSLNMSDAVWLFDFANIGRASLIIDFHPNRHGPGIAADLYDDQDGDGAVAYTVRDGAPVASESRFPTIQVVAPDGWWVRDGRINYNLFVNVDGQVQASFGSEVFYRQFRTDGQIDFRMEVHDDNQDGRPDWELIRAYPTLSSSSGVLRSLLMVSTHGDSPVDDYVFWPLLGISAGLREGYEGGQVTAYVDPDRGIDYGIVKNYTSSFAPIQVEWPLAKIRYVGEFVASRGSADNWFIYSLYPFGIDGATYADFENPFAFYDLAGVRDGYPDLAIRQEFLGPRDRFFAQGKFDLPIQNIRYSWDQEHDHAWDYRLTLLGRHPIDMLTTIGTLAVETVPYSEYPSWVTNHDWDIAEFVATESGKWTSEGIYESGLNELFLRDQYLTGETSRLPADSFGWADEGFRSEYSLNYAEQPRLYLSLVDRRLHLRGAQAGTWQIDQDRALRYSSLGGPYFNCWTLVDRGRQVASLWLVADQVIFVDSGGTRMKRLDAAPVLYTTAPPIDHEGWTQLGEAMRRAEPRLLPEDLSGMFDRLPGPVQTLPQVSVYDVHLTAEGFRAVLEAGDVPDVDAAWATGLSPGSHGLEYRIRGGYTVTPPSAGGVELGLRPVADGQPRALHPLKLGVTLRNESMQDVRAVSVRVDATLGDGTVVPVGQASIGVSGGATSEVLLDWIPPRDGEWVLQAVAAAQSARTELGVSVAPALDSGLLSLLAAQAFPIPVVGSVGVTLVTLVMLVGGLGLWLLRRPGSPARGASDRPRS